MVEIFSEREKLPPSSSFIQSFWEHVPNIGLRVYKYSGKVHQRRGIMHQKQRSNIIKFMVIKLYMLIKLLYIIMKFPAIKLITLLFFNNKGRIYPIKKNCAHYIVLAIFCKRNSF